MTEFNVLNHMLHPSSNNGLHVCIQDSCVDMFVLIIFLNFYIFLVYIIQDIGILMSLMCVLTLCDYKVVGAWMPKIWIYIAIAMYVDYI